MTFYSEVRQIEKRDSVLTSKNQIERLTRPGSSYFNLNPFEVLQIDPEVTDEEIKKSFRQLSILVHPDKNQDDADRAQKAFEAVDKAYKLLLDQEQKKRALDVIQAGKEYVEHTVSIYSAAMFTGSISAPWAPCRRVNVTVDIATPAWPDCPCGLRFFAVAVVMHSACLKLAFTPGAEGAWPRRCTYLFP